MTEYDFSPEAYEKHLATQTRVMNWVSDQASHAPHYKDPIRVPHSPRRVPPPPLERLRIPEPEPARSSPLRSSPLRSSPPKSATQRPPPAPQPIAVPPPGPAPSPSVVRRATGAVPSAVANPPRPRPLASRSRTLPHAHALPVPVPVPATPVAPHPHALPAAPPGHAAVYRQYQYDPMRKEIILPPPRRGETYVIVPPHRGPIEVIPGDGGYLHSRAHSHSHPHSQISRSESYSSSSRSPTKRSGTPLFKRIFASISPTASRGASAARGGPPLPRSHPPPPRRLRRHPTSQF
ncbi:hypothetical protein WOLCODRAFT_139769 [Wolfiporia cocos MD-104 SS10]|uniref:Uncharacterized protein n=1 Tax=Wolfiporia cocos (strain MD-104) TaxID=742152 RepID=A0A2H3IZJ9_WOLCO|nr:hypothetical protein WOLCODRAFT_139769 [Wolfiporia cocos MD-104 SS10]